ncbi:MAG: protein translocase subunit SecA 1 [Candidatus Babeliales bacterium]
MIARILAIILGTNNARQLRKIQPIVEKINALEPGISALSDESLAAKTVEFKERLAKGETLDDILPEAFAVVREASKRRIGQRHYDVQLIGGIVLHQGKIAEMKTGEGKTLTATLPLYLNALAGKGATLVTVNDYLAKRDSEWMSQIFTSLGLTVGCLQNHMEDSERKKQYACDILYATNNELGFDYLRDNMKFRLEDYVQRELSYAIVDEVDSILIDEARTPLIISGASGESSQLYLICDKVVRRLEKGVDYEVDEKQRSVQLTESGNDKCEKALNIPNLYAVESLNILHHVNQALRAHSLFKKDVDYVVRDGEVLIVDEFTGRILPGRRYSDGLHQALEAKEAVDIEKETQTLAAITLQNYFRLYKKLAGMTGTAQTEAEEFYRTYNLDVVSIPTNKPMIRLDKPDLIFLTKNAKYKAIVQDVKERHKKGQPVLIGTIAIETSELLSDILTASGIPHDVLNAKHHQREAEIVEHAGEFGKVTIATNMAGRGTDIKLNPESVKAGGLYILGTERHESRRIDNQLRGRSGRQGDPGESRFYISLEDELIRIYSGGTLKQRMEWLGMKEDEIIESKMISKRIEEVQERVEKQNFDVRKHLLEYDDVLNQQRIVIYKIRREVLEGGDNVYDLVQDMISQTVADTVARNCMTRAITPEQKQAIFAELAQLTGLKPADFESAKLSDKNREELEVSLIKLLLEKYETHRSRQNQEVIKNAEKWLMLETIDQAWKQHMLNLDHLKEGINLRSYSQKNPLIEYKREAFQMFQEVMQDIRRITVHHIFHVNTQHFDSHELEKKREREMDEINLLSGHNSEEGEAQPQAKRTDQPGRNEPCNCGSGKKFKKCHGESK